MSTRVQIAFDLSATAGVNFFTLDDTDKGVLDNTAYLLGGDVLIDVTQYVRDFTVNRGRSTTLQHFTAGQANVTLDNRTRIFDPTYAAGTYYGQILPRKQIVIDRDSEVIYTGLVEDWNFNYDVSGQSLAEVSASDGFTLVANQTRTAGTATAQATGARVAAVLTEIGWPLTQRNISVGQATLDADVVAADDNALNYLQKVETSEPGALFIGKAGDFTFRDRADLQTYTSGLTFGGTGIPFTGMGVVFGVEELLNVSSVTFTAAGVIAGTAIATDAASQTAYGTIDETIDTLLASSADATALANWRVGTLSQPRYRIDAITISLEGCTPAQALQVLDVELGDVATVTWTPNSIGSAISQIVTVDQIAHDATPDRHDVTFTMSETIAAFILDDAIYGVLDDDILGF
jgi:hypothetical protein